MPVAMPTWRNVLLMPDAMPLRRGATTPIAVEASGGLTMPIPTPATRKPGSSAVHVRVGVERRASAAAPIADERPGRRRAARAGHARGQPPGDRRDEERQQRQRQEAQARPPAASSRARSGCRA